MRTLGWLLLCVFLVLPFIFTAVIIIRKKKAGPISSTTTTEGTETSSWLEKAWGWLEKSGKLFLVMAIGIVITLSVREFWRQEWDSFFLKHGWYAWTVTIMANVLFCYLFGRGYETGSDEEGHAHGSGEKSGLGALAMVLAAIVVIGVIAAVVIMNSRQGQMTNTTAQGLPRNDTYALTKNGWTQVSIGQGIDAVWHAPDKYFYRYDNEPTVYEDKPDITVKKAKRRGPYKVYFQAEEVPTTVSVFQTAMP